MADKIMVVDDDPDTVKFINIMLSRLGYQVISATSGMEALERAGGAPRSDHPRRDDAGDGRLRGQPKSSP